ncbi:DNA phosphorothioation-associated putative methyltransferase [Variovorax sp. WS11]|uniref:DNA phosphorothioation-associated putative methyltransferase n=1 Tax=Variovorax sp. WS11 TaxID=1105204 RepID=UPI001EF375C9|nr:DNA phosphorothioation-associated putative methyltransferase [Variovorax sp. WS11]
MHLSAIACLPNADHQAQLQAALAALPVDVRQRVNVAKINLRTARISLLEYPTFEDDPFPALASSWSRQGGSGSTLRLRTYSDSLNPPLLHRKELLVHPKHPRRAKWRAITETAESLGLFDDSRIIGFQLNWERAIASRGFQLVGEQFVPIANAIDAIESPDSSAARPVQRHLTALSRTAISAPVQLLLRHGLLARERRFFDYGCGRGDDVAALVADGFAASGWDPHFAANEPMSSAEVVNVGFVINVIEDPAERVEVLHGAFELTRGVMAVAVMLYGPGSAGRPLGDGFVTLRGTFQKYFNQAELKDYLEHVLHQEAFLVGPGIAFIFANKEWEQSFLASRYRRKDIGTRLLSMQSRLRLRARERSPRRPDPTVDVPEQPHPLLQALWRLALDLGRLPDEDEVPELNEVIREFGSLQRSLRHLLKSFDDALLDQARAARADDLRLYFALQQFAKRPRYRELEAWLQRDIKAFFGDYANAQAAGVQLLKEAADPSVVLKACQDAATRGLGWLDGDHDLQLHVSSIERLPSVLRAYVACGLQLYGDLADIDLVKIHIGSGKLSLMQYENFSQSPTPAMTKRIKVNMRHTDYEVFEYGREFPKPLLFNKSRFMHEEVEGYAEQLAFDEALATTGVLSDSEFGLSPDNLLQALRMLRLEISGSRLVRGTSIPDLDDACGARFTYRQLIQCGETQAALALLNVPREAESFNALYDLATKLLDPVVDYFGTIRVTYGFCSPDLAKHIHARIAPELDQHAAHERKRNGQLVCSRGGAACDFVVDDEDMREVADWIVENLPFDRLYFYAPDRPIHVSYAPSESREAFAMTPTVSGKMVPRRYSRR